MLYRRALSFLAFIVLLSVDFGGDRTRKTAPRVGRLQSDQ